jgi:predicted flap endonuclease-1-like 5' DNA nuclease
MDRSIKAMIAIFTLVASTFLTMNRAVEEAPMEDWWLAGLMFAVSAAFWVWMWREAEDEAQALVLAEEAPPLPVVHEWVIDPPAVSANGADEKPMETEDVVAPSPAETTNQVVHDGEEAEPVQEAKSGEPISEAVVAESMAAPDTPDDLTQIEGIGPRYRDALTAAGITTFAQLAETSQETLEQAAEDAGMRRAASMETWREQAALAARGDWEALEKLQESLSGGRR